jgi:hypothetical protein
MPSQRTTPQVGVAVSRAVIIEKATGEGSSRRARFVASDETVDRYGDIIRASGWQLDNFRKNPVLLFGHQSGALPVGKVEPIAVEGTRLIACRIHTRRHVGVCRHGVGDGGSGLRLGSVGRLPAARRAQPDLRRRQASHRL